MERIDDLSTANSGTFRHANGEELPWLYRIAANRCIDRRRRRSFRAFIGLDAMPDEMADEGPAADAEHAASFAA